MGKDGEKRRDPEEVPGMHRGCQEEDGAERPERGPKGRSLAPEKHQGEGGEDRGDDELGA